MCRQSVNLCVGVADYIKSKVITTVMLLLVLVILALVVAVILLNVRVEHQGAELRHILLTKVFKKLAKKKAHHG